MSLFHRDFAMYARNFGMLPSYPLYFLRCIQRMRHPADFLAAYIRMAPPSGNVVEMRGGMKIHLSSHPHDAVTVFLIFLREDYGRIAPKSIIVDIGANIGVFSLYAAYSDAARILAYEPNSESFQSLKNNVESNGLETVIQPHHLAVGAVSGRQVRFPKTSSPYNAVLRDNTSETYDLVETVDLRRILQDVPHVDLLKMDCEGAEGEILNAADPELFSRIDAIRMEYHLSLRDEIIALLRKYGFRVRFLRGPKAAGTAWFDKIRSQ
jgi:FkbM family methyltransferase